MRPRPSSIVAYTTILLLAAPVAAEEQDEAPSTTTWGGPVIPTGGHGSPTAGPKPPPGTKAPSGVSGEVGGGILFEKIGEDHFVTLDLYNQTRIGPVSFGVWVPLRLRVWDKGDDDGVLREEDWDEVSDYARLLRFVELSLGGETWRFRGRFGALEGESIGHGTILAGYYNSLDRDHYQAGLALAAAIRYGGVELMLDNLLAPEIFGTRIHVRPAAFFTDNFWANRFVAGLSFVADVKAPVALRTEGVAPDLAPVIDDKNNYAFTDTDTLGVLGVDLEYTVIQNKLMDLVPYMDINFMFDEGTGAGFHLGTFFNLRIPTPVGPALLTRLEYRAVGNGYAPRYVDTLYEAQRVQYAPVAVVDPDGVPLTKLGWLRSADTGPHGWLGELYLDLAGWVRVGGTYEDYQGPDNSALTLSLLLPKLPFVQLGAYYSRRGFDSISEAFDRDGALLVAYGRAKVWGPFYLSAVYSRTWHVQEDGTYKAEGDYAFGAGVSFRY